MSMDDIIMKATAIYNQLKTSSNLTTSTKRVIGLVVSESGTHSTSSDDESVEEQERDMTMPDSNASFSTSFDTDIEKNCEKGIMFHM